jgi:FMN phosphatase YigB (HAD superfamily)
MALSLEAYANWLDGRELPWPQAPEPERIKARPHLSRLPKLRAVLWTVYGTLLRISTGELLFEHPTAFIMDNALDKTLQEFKMWGSMSRKPGQPAEYLGQIYRQVLLEQRAFSTGGERHPEVSAERVWETILKKLFQKDYKFDAAFYGALNEYSRKVAYFFHASMQGTACYAGAAAALRHVADAGLTQGLLADAQCFTGVQLQRGLSAEDESIRLEEVLTEGVSALSYEVRGRKPSERLFRHSLDALLERGIGPDETLHVGSSVTRDIVPSRRLGLRTALFAGDRASLQATPEQMKDPHTRPDVLLTSPEQIAEVVSGQ